MKSVHSPATEPWTTRRLLAWTAEYLASHGVEHPRLSAEMLLSHILGTSRLRLYTDMERPASELERAAYRDLVERASRHEPVDYLVGRCPFFALMLEVSPAVLIPRPSTETLVEHVIQHSSRTPGFRSPRIADVCTGSGAVAIALAKQLPHATVIATDISNEALALAQKNARAHGVDDRIEFRQGDLLVPLVGERLAYLVSNPPYISDAQWRKVSRNVRDYEPHLALRGGADGLKFIRPLIEQAHHYLPKPGQLVLEIDSPQQKAVLEQAGSATGLTNPRVLADHEGLPRILVADTT